MFVISLSIFAQDGIGDGIRSFKMMATVIDTTKEEPYVDIVHIDCTDEVITFYSKILKWEYALPLNLNPRLKYRHETTEEYEYWAVMDDDMCESVGWYVMNDGDYALNIASGEENGKVRLKSFTPIDMFQVHPKTREVIKELSIKEFSDYIIRYMKQLEK